VMVQPLSNLVQGFPGDPVPLFAPAWYVSSEAPATKAPHVFPADSLGPAAQTITVYLPGLAPGLAIAGTDPFIFAANSDTGTKDVYPYTLTFQSDGATWAFDASP